MSLSLSRTCLALAAGVLVLATGCRDDEAKSPSAESVAVALDGAAPLTDVQRMLDTVAELSSDAYGGREPMSEGERMTLDFIQQRFEEAGLEPLFAEGYRQPVDLVSIEADPASARMTFRLGERDRLVAHASEMVLGTPRVVPESRVENSDVVFVGYGIVAPEYGWNDYADVDVRDKTVLILVNDPGFATQNPQLFNGNAMTYYGRWTYKYEEAARQGAAAAIIIHDTEPASYGWDVVRNSWTGPQFHMAHANDNLHRSALESWIQRSVAEEIVAASGHDLADLMRQAVSAEFRAIELDTSMDASVENRIIRNQSYNIGAILPGSERPDELFIYTAHWDHIGTNPAAAPGEDAIYNGAVDNATGIAALLELARSFAALPRAPRRSIAFLAVTAEESGLIGSAWYAEHPPVPMRQTVAGVNMDAMHVHGPTRDVIVIGHGSSELEDILGARASAQGRVVRPEEHPERGYYYRSDHFNFARKGTPMLYAKAGSEHTEREPDYIPGKNDEYLKTRYHTPLDEMQDDWDLRGLVQDIELYFGIGLEVAEGDAWPNWYEGSEFRAIRDRSRAGSP